MFDAIDASLNKLFNKSELKPSDMEFIYHTFWEKGIDYNAFNKLPIPYIMGILRTKKYIVDLKEKEMKKAK